MLAGLAAAVALLVLAALALRFAVPRPPSFIARTADSPGLYDPWPYEKFAEPHGAHIAALSQDQKEALVGTARRALTGAEAPEADRAFDGAEREVHVAFRRNGTIAAGATARAGNLQTAVFDAATSAAAKLPPEAGGDLHIHIYVIGGEEPFDSYSQWRATEGFAGLRIYIDGALRAERMPASAIEANLTPEKWVTALCAEAGLDEFCEGPGVVERRVFDAVHFGTTRFRGETVTFLRGFVPDLAPDLTREKVQASADLAFEWLRDNLRADGFFNYEYAPSLGAYSAGDNAIRQLMPARLLAEMAQRDGTYAALHRRNLAALMKQWYRERNGEGYMFFQENSKLGANGIALRTLAASPSFDDYRAEADALAAGIVALMNEDGALKPWYIPSPTSETGETRLLYFYSGEALLGLVEQYERTGDARWLEAAERGQGWYLGEYVDRMAENYYPAYVPWHTMSLFKLHRITGNPRYAEAIFALNDRLLELQHTVPGDRPDCLGRFYQPHLKHYGTPHASSTGVYMDGLTYAFELARDLDDAARAERYRRAIVLAVHNLINLQYKGADMYYVEHPERVKGAIRTDAVRNRIRVDNTQHALDGMIRALDLFGDEDWRLENSG